MRIAFIGYGNVGKALLQLIGNKQSVYPFSVVGIHTHSHGTAYDPKGLAAGFAFSEQAKSVEVFLDRAKPDAAVEITTLNPENGEPALSHIRAALARKIHVVTANKGPIAHAYADIFEQARANGVKLRFESTVMDGTPLFNMVRHTLPAVRILGFTGTLNSTSKIVVTAMERGLSMSQGISEAQRMGIAEADASYDLEGWDSAAKTAVLANVLMHAGVTPQQVSRTGIGDLTVDVALENAKKGETVLLVSRGRYLEDGSLDLQVAPETLPHTDLLAAARGTSNLLLLHTDLMGTLGIMSIDPGVQQTAYGVFSDLVGIAHGQ